MENKFVNNEKLTNQGNINIDKQINIYKLENSNNHSQQDKKSFKEYSEIIDLTNGNVNATFPNLPQDIIIRDEYLNVIEKKLEFSDILFINGETGVGITTLLALFAREKSNSVISHFFSFRQTYLPEFLIDNLARQIHFYSTNEIIDEIFTDDTLSNLYKNFLRKIRINEKNNQKLYFIFDGINHLDKSDIESLKNILENLPYGRTKFIFSCNEQFLELVIPKNLHRASIEIFNFSITQTEDFLEDITKDKDICREIHQFAHRGLPSKLRQVKRLYYSLSTDIQQFLLTLNSNPDLFEIEWKNVNNSDELFIALIAFNDESYKIEKISQIINISVTEIDAIIQRIKFIEKVNDELVFISTPHRNYAKDKLKTYQEKTWSLIIDYYERNKNSDESIFNLPNLYHKAKKWNELTKLLSLDAFIIFVEKYQSISNVKQQIEYGLEAAKHLNTDNNFIGDILRFALHKSSFLEMEKFEMWESEVEARIALDQYDEAILLANKVLLKEDRLKMLSIIAKQLKIINKPIDNELIVQIKELYKQIDFTEIKEKAVEISNYFIYFDFELAIELLEKVIDNNTKNNSVDYAYAYLSMFAQNINKNANSRLVDVDLLNSKIKDEKAKDLTEALDFLSDEFDAQSIIDKATKLDNVSRKIFLLRYWIENNKEKENIDKVIEFALNEIITAADENIPNASALNDIASPLPYILDLSKVERLIRVHP